MAFDFDGAEAAGISRQDILKEMEKSGKVGYDFTGARKAGVSVDDMYDTIKTKLTATDLPELPTSLDDIVPGPPVEDGVTPKISIGEITVIPEVPTNVGADSQTTLPSQIQYDEQGKPLIGIQSSTSIIDKQKAETGIRDEAFSKAQEEANRKGFATYVDPITGEKKRVSEGGIEPAYDILFGPGGRLGMFGILSGQAGAEAGKIIGKKSAEIASKIDEQFAKHPAAGLGDALSTEAKYIINRHPNLTEDEVIQTLQGVKTADQAYALSRMLGETGYIRQAVRAEGDAPAGMLRADLEDARAKILQTVGTVDVAQAKAKYADMVKAIAGDYKNVHNASGITEDLDFLERFYGVTPSAGNRVVTQMKATLGDNPNINLSDALEFRADLSHLISKATRGKEKVKLNSIKENLDGFINSVATPEQKSMIDEAIGTYSRTMQNRDVLELVEKNTKDGIAVNWTKLHRDLNDANLRSPEAVDALRIAEAFSKRFGNDKKLLNIAMPAGSSPDSGGVLGAWGYVINHLKDTLALYGNRAENLKIQKAILKSLKNGRTNLDFVDNLKANKDIPDEVTKIFEELNKVPEQIPYKTGARQTGDVNLEPIITPVGGTEKVVPVEQVIPPLSENKALQQSLDKIPTKPSNATERETPYSPQSEESGIQVANEIYRQGSHLAERRIEELQGYGDRTIAETAELRTLQDHMIEAGTRHKDDVVRTTDLPEAARITNGDDGYYYIELPPYNGTNVLGQSGRTPTEVRRLAEDTFGRFNIPLASNAEIKAANGGSTSSQGIAETLSPSTRTPIQQAEETFNTLRRDIQRLERVRVADRTPQQSAQLSEMRRERLLASREVERLRAGGEGADRLFNSFRSSDHTIEVVDRGNGSFTLSFNGNRVPMTIRTNGIVSLNTQGFAQGSGQGAQFYKEFYKALDAAGLKHNVSGLTNVNQMRLPINIYKHKLDTGNLPITGGQAKLQSLMRDAIRKINEVAGREVKYLTDGQLEELAKRTGPMRDVHAGVNSLKLYRKAARLLSDGRALSIGALAPLINAAYEEGQD